MESETECKVPEKSSDLKELENTISAAFSAVDRLRCKIDCTLEELKGNPASESGTDSKDSEQPKNRIIGCNSRVNELICKINGLNDLISEFTEIVGK